MNKLVKNFFLLSVVVSFLFIGWIWGVLRVLEIPATTELVLILTFTLITGIWIYTYLLFRQVFTREISELNKKIESRLLEKLENIDDHSYHEILPMERLAKNIQSVIEQREKEKKHYENLDSYRKEYLGNVSHELKTPIFNIQGFIETLINGGLYDENINMEYLKKAEKSVERMINIIDDLETITQLETGNLQLDFEKIDLVKLVKDIYGQLELLASKNKIKLKFDKKYDKPINVIADEHRIRQVFVNLITNSIKYGKENGETIISFSFFKDDVIISVKDNGVGIEEKHLPRIFERFYRVDKGRSREQGGTGLGLAIVKHIIEAHQSSITVKSKPGEGTEFIFYLKRFE